MKTQLTLEQRRLLKRCLDNLEKMNTIANGIDARLARKMKKAA